MNKTEIINPFQRVEDNKIEEEESEKAVLEPEAFKKEVVPDSVMEYSQDEENPLN